MTIQRDVWTSLATGKLTASGYIHNTEDSVAAVGGRGLAVVDYKVTKKEGEEVLHRDYNGLQK